MQSINFDAVNSKQHITNTNLKLFLKNTATHANALRALMGAPHRDVVLIKLMLCIGEAKILGNKFLPSTILCERSERIEFLNYSKLKILKGGFIA